MKILVLALAAFMVQNANATSKTISLTGENLFPEGIAFRKETKTFYVGSAGNGSVQVVTTRGEARVIQPAGTDGRTKSLGIAVDEKRNRLFVLGATSAYIYTLDTNRLLKKFATTELVAVSESALNDLAIDNDGNAYITDSFNPHIIRVNGRTLEPEIFARLEGIPFGKQNDIPYNLNGIVISPDAKSLITIKTNDGTLWKIDLDTRQASEIKTSENLFRGDGLALNGTELYVIRNFVNKISMLDLAEKAETKTVTTTTPANTKVPTTAALVHGKSGGKLVVVNSQFGENAPTHPFTLAVVPVSKLK